jgi:sec-independent protein translocase protein TatA
VPFDLSMGEFLVILLVALLVFGGKLPDTARKVGHALSEFKRGMREELRKVEEGVRTDNPPPPKADETPTDAAPKGEASPGVEAPPKAEAAPAEPSRLDP